MITKQIIAIRGDKMWGFIGGKSAHNTRIERFWRRYNTNVITNFYNKCTLLENLGYLNRNNNNDLWVLHIVYLSAINKKLEEIKSYFNNHPIYSVRGKTPQ